MLLTVRSRLRSRSFVGEERQQVLADVRAQRAVRVGVGLALGVVQPLSRDVQERQLAVGAVTVVVAAWYQLPPRLAQRGCRHQLRVDESARALLRPLMLLAELADVATNLHVPAAFTCQQRRPSASVRAKSVPVSLAGIRACNRLLGGEGRAPGSCFPGRRRRGPESARRARRVYGKIYERQGAGRRCPPTKKASDFRSFCDGASRARTGDLLHAMQALSQLSYSPLVDAARNKLNTRACRPATKILRKAGSE